jgi:hypothetical protein
MTHQYTCKDCKDTKVYVGLGLTHSEPRRSYQNVDMILRANGSGGPDRTQIGVFERWVQ